MTPDLSTYTTSELARLAALNKDTIRDGEFVKIPGIVVFKTQTGLADKAGVVYNWAFNKGEVLRRVRSFTDLTEVDPSVEVMQAELRRRAQAAGAAKAFKVGDTVAWHGNTYQVKEVKPTTTTSLTLTRKDGWMDVSVDATAVTKVTAPQPIPGQVYRHRETTDADPTKKGGYNLRKFEDGVWHYAHTVTGLFEREAGAFGSTGQRLWDSGVLVPYTPPVISNAAHAGRRVHYANQEFTARVVSSSVAKRLHNEYLSIGTVVVIKDDGSSTWAPSHRWTLLD